MNGTVMIIQSAKEMVIPERAKKLKAIAFGGVPMGVPIPPKLQAKGIESAKAFEKLLV